MNEKRTQLIIAISAIILFVLFILGIFFLIYNTEKMIDSKKVLGCKIYFLRQVHQQVSDIERLQEHKQICPDAECESYMDSKIKQKEDFITELLNYSGGCEE